MVKDICFSKQEANISDTFKTVKSKDSEHISNSMALPTKVYGKTDSYYRRLHNYMNQSVERAQMKINNLSR